MKPAIQPTPFFLPMLVLLMLSLLMLLLSAGCASLAVARPQLRTVDRVQDSIVHVTSRAMIESWIGQVEQGVSCTGEVIATHRVLTANHCIGTGPVYADGVLAKVLRTDTYYDLALLDVPVNRPALRLRDTPIHRLDPVVGIGYAFGFTKLVDLPGYVVLVDYSPDPALPPGVMMTPSYIEGMSGGPLVDAAGQLVSVIQIRNEGIGYGVGTVLIRAFLLGVE